MSNNIIVAPEQEISNIVSAKVKIANIPAELQRLNSWVLWRYKVKASGKRTKVPYNANASPFDEYQKASSTDPNTWASFARVIQTFAERINEFDGIGIVLKEGYRIVGLDGDGIVGTPAADEMLTIDTYAEISPSGRGLRMFGFGDLPFNGRKHVWLELYKTARFLTITGNVVGGVVKPMNDIQPHVDVLVERYFPPEPETEPVEPPKLAYDEEQIITLAKYYGGDKFAALWNYQPSGLLGLGFGSADDPTVVDNSRAQQSLAGALAFYTRDPEQLSKLLLASGASQEPKILSKNHRERTIKKALMYQTDTYKPSEPAGPATDEEIAAVIKEWPDSASNVSVTPVSTKYDYSIEPPCLEDCPTYILKSTADEPTAPKPKRPAYKISDFHKIQKSKWQIKNWLPMRSMAAIYGPPAAAKSFIALDLAMCIATGKQFQGQYDVKQGPVLYVYSEGFDGLPQRVQAWLDYHNMKAPDNIAFIGSAFDLRDRTEAEEILATAVEVLGCNPSLIVIDTLHRNYGGGAESDEKDMGAFLYNADFLRVTAEATTLIVHHTGKDVSKGLRGHSSFACACNTILQVTSNEGGTVSTLRVEKQKDGSQGDKYQFQKKILVTGFDEEEQEEVTSCVFTLSAHVEMDAIEIDDNAIMLECVTEEKTTSGELIDTIQKLSQLKLGRKPGTKAIAKDLKQAAIDGFIQTEIGLKNAIYYWK